MREYQNPPRYLKTNYKYRNEIKLKRDELTVAGITQMYMDCPSDEGKYDTLAHLYGLLTVGSSVSTYLTYMCCRIYTNLLIDNLLQTQGHCLRNRREIDSCWP
jgi:hypothetical protein